MNKNVVITIGRQFGSGGRYVGRLLAEKLGVPFYDKELLSEAAKNSGICEEIFEEHDEKPTRSLLFSLVTGMQSHMAAGNFYMDMPLNHKIFLAQFDAIRRIAGEGSCVIVGRCADYVLRENPDAVSIFVKGDMESKIARAVKYYGIEEDKAEERKTPFMEVITKYPRSVIRGTLVGMSSYTVQGLMTVWAMCFITRGWSVSTLMPGSMMTAS